MTTAVTQMLVILAREAVEVFHDHQDRPWAWDGQEAHRIGSSAFGDLLARDLYERTGKVATPNQLKAAMNTLQGMARWDGPVLPVSLRMAGHDGRVILDLADEDRHIVVIGPDGWEVGADSPIRFHRPDGMLPLPVPVRGGSLELLADLWPVRDDDLVLAWAWLLGCFNPSGAKPLLDLAGVQGSGKSLLARMILSLVDPTASGLLTLPTNPRDLAVILQTHAVPGFDNVSLIPSEMSDALCRTASGMGFELRKLYTDDDVARFVATRPVLLTGIPEVARQPDMADRTISLVLREFGEVQRLTEAEVLARFEEIRPALLGLLLDGVSRALANLGDIILDHRPRMLDWASWVEAGAPAFNWERGRFLATYMANRREALASSIEGSAIGPLIAKLAEVGFTGTATECLTELAARGGNDVTRQRGWPVTGRGLSGVIRRLQPALRDAGVMVELLAPVGEGHQRVIRISRIPDPEEREALVVRLPLRTQRADRLGQVVGALRAIGVDAEMPITRAAGLALGKAGGDSALAACALNELGVAAPDGGPWTASGLRAVI